MKICIIGNGAIAIFLAELLSKRSEFNITVVGSYKASKNGSLAAGAMHASTGEVECELENNSNNYVLYNAALSARKLMKELINSYAPSCFTANGTVVFLNRNANEFERKNFQYVKKAAEKYDELEICNNNDFFKKNDIHKKSESIYLRKEFAFDPRILIESIKEKIASRTTFLDDIVDSINIENKQINTSSGKSLVFDFIFIANGAGKVNLNGLINKIVPSFLGVGLALLGDNSNVIDSAIVPSTVYRSVNRGGSQCGFHFVPCANSKFYIGAGNRLSFKGNDQIRFDTIRYLMNQSENDVFGLNSFYSISGKLLTGFRSRTFDFYPNFGPIIENNNIFLLNGFNRVGLSLAPYLAKIASDFIDNKKLQNSLIQRFKPQRNFISHGLPSECAKEFSEITCANLVEHALLSPETKEYEEKKAQLFEEGYNHIQKIQEKFNLSSEYGPAPDSLSTLVNASNLI